MLRRRSGNMALTEADYDTEDKLMTAIYKEIPVKSAVKMIVNGSW
ncbi:MAG: hypothetical protein ACLU4J_11150 [Butyricimonas paravirosa]